MNLIKVNFPAIDLGNDEEKISVQITSRLDKKKYNETQEMFFKHRLDKTFLNLHLLSIGDPDYEREETVQGIRIKTIKRSDLLDQISQRTVPELLTIRQFFDSELHFSFKYSQVFRNLRLMIYLPQKIELKSIGDSVKIAELFNTHPLCEILDHDFNSLTRNLLQEIVENSFRHGNATNLSIMISPTKISICENGTPFSPRKLRFVKNPNMGAMAFTDYFIKKFRNFASCRYFVDKDNKKNIIDVNYMQPISTLKPIEACVIRQDEVSRKEIVDGCSITYVNYDRDSSSSHNSTFYQRLQKIGLAHKSNFGIALNERDRAMEEPLMRKFPGISIKIIKS